MHKFKSVSIIWQCAVTLFVWAAPLQSVGTSFPPAHVRLNIGQSGAQHEAGAIGARRLMRPRSRSTPADYCATGNFTALYDTIDKDLQYWRQTGITAKMMDLTQDVIFNYPMRHKGAGILFKGGKPYLITDATLLNTVGHHKRLVAAHFALFLALSSTFGAAIPDVEFVFNSADEPTALLHHFENGTRPEQLPLVLSFCKSERSHADVLVPDIHFFMRNFTTKLLGQASNFSRAWPWKKKQERLFGRFSPYPRVANKRAPELYRKGKGGKDICDEASTDLWFCNVRKHYIWEWARGANWSGLPLDIAQQPKRDMMHHASHKWVLHLDGQTCSSRLEQLLVLNSLVFKEQSGYRAFFHHLIHPFKHYVPIWTEGPEDTKHMITWAKEHDAEAANIAAAAQQVALRYLHNRALMCYWLKLLQEMGGMMRYEPGPEGGSRKYAHMQPLDEYMQAEGWQELAANKLGPFEFWD